MNYTGPFLSQYFALKINNNEHMQKLSHKTGKCVQSLLVIYFCFVIFRFYGLINTIKQVGHYGWSSIYSSF